METTLCKIKMTSSHLNNLEQTRANWFRILSLNQVLMKWCKKL